MRKDEIHMMHVAVNETKRNMEKKLGEVEEYGRPAHDAIKRGIKSLDRLINELELYMEI